MSRDWRRVPMPTRIDNLSNYEFGDDGSDEMWDLLNLYADGEASPEEAVLVEALLKSDAEYARQFSFVKTTAAAVQTFSEIDPPSSLRSAILDATSRRQTIGTRFAAFREAILGSLAPRYASSLAGLAAAGLLAIAVFQHGGHPESVARTEAVKAPPRVAVSRPIRESVSPKGGGTTIAASAVVPAMPGTRRYGPPSARFVAAVNTRSGAANSAALVTQKPRKLQSNAVAHPDDSTSSQAMAAAFRPGMDDQNQRTPAPVDQLDSAGTDISGPDVHYAEVATAATTGTAPGTNSKTGPGATAASEPAVVSHVIVAKLTALPPDPNQVLTHGDMARNRAALNSGYDRTTLRSMERKEASISLLRGTF